MEKKILFIAALFVFGAGVLFLCALGVFFALGLIFFPYVYSGVGAAKMIAVSDILEIAAKILAPLLLMSVIYSGFYIAERSSLKKTGKGLDDSRWNICLVVCIVLFLFSVRLVF